MSDNLPAEPTTAPGIKSAPSQPSAPAPPTASPPEQQQSQALSGQTHSGGPVGTGNYEVQQGDCIESIAFDHGFFWQSIWDHSNNQQLKTQRKDQNVLLAGDRVFIPDLRPKQETGGTEKRHRFKRKGVPSKLRLILRHHDEPQPNVPYVLEVDGQIVRGETDDNGSLVEPIPPNAQRGKIIIGTGDEQEEHTLYFGQLDPIDTANGVRARLNSLGFDCGPPDGTAGPKMQEALRDFQRKYGITESGEIDQSTLNELQKQYGR